MCAAASFIPNRKYLAGTISSRLESTFPVSRKLFQQCPEKKRRLPALAEKFRGYEYG